ncbi:MAG: hypothetical protein WCB27_23305 [Thermoguttaceae bacterium]
MDNPYQSPEEPGTPFGSGSPMDGNRRQRGLVNHVRAVAILMLVQGGLEVFAALVFAVFAVVIPALLRNQEIWQRPPPNPPPEYVFWIMIAVYGVMAMAALVVAILHIMAGVRNYRFRGRVLGIVAPYEPT